MKLINKLIKLSKFSTHPKNIEQISQILKKCADKNIIEDKSLKMMEGVLQTSKIRVRDIMIPRAQMVCINSNQTPLECIQIIQKSKHSRYPVINEDKDDIIGFLLAKDMLIYIGEKTIQHKLEELYHKPFFTPESKRLDDLLRDFQKNHIHMAIVADEYGGVAGLVTIEDIIEQIVGDIEDEFYQDDEQECITKFKDNFLIKGSAEVKDINIALNIIIDNPNNFDTISGVIINKFGYIPKVKESLDAYNYTWEIAAMEQCCIKSLIVKPNKTNIKSAEK